MRNKVSGKYSFILFCLLTSVCLFLPYSASAYFDFNPNCQLAMQAILDLRLKDARSMLGQEKVLHPENGYTIYLEHYAESIELLITENKKIYEKLINSYEERMDQMDRLDDGSPVNEWLRSEMLFLTGLAQIRFGTRISGAYKLLSSFTMVREHREKYPQFWQNQKLTGMFNIMLDFVPPSMRWVADMFGFTGNAQLGIYQLKQYCELAKGTPGLEEEGVLITNLAYKLTWQEEEGFKFIAGQDEKMLGTALIKYLYANAAIYTYKNDLALKMLAEINPDSLQVKFYGLSYVTGRCKLNHLEKDASIYLENYLDTYPGLDYKKDACNRLSYYYLINCDMKKFEEYRARVAAVGKDLRDRDQEAILESSDTLVPHTGLLKARLLCDGGYFGDAAGILKSIDPLQLNEISYQLEYHYRLGRILQLSGHPDEAIIELSMAFNDGKTYPFTFATRAALNLGKIYEEKKEYASASEWYGRCIDVFSSSHTTEGVKDMAEKGVKRLKGKF